MNRNFLRFSPISIIAIILLTSWASACQGSGPSVIEPCLTTVFVDTTKGAYPLGYKLDEPDAVFKLPGRLEEISGLSIGNNDQSLLAVQDEEGKVFVINKETGEVDREFKFWKDGDYEGIEAIGHTVYVVKSTGTIYKITEKDGEEEPEVIKYNTFLDGGNDVEGLAYDPVANQLLLACKASAGGDNEFELTKAIYAFDLARFELLPAPRYCIKLEDVNEYLNTDPLIRKLEKLNEFFAPGDAEFGFSPSALAIHPKTRDIYILSSIGTILMILSQEGRLQHIEKLHKSIHEQPEGICFDTEGNLFISNEGKGGKGTIYRFNVSDQ